jgi:hypothetical protein
LFVPRRHCGDLRQILSLAEMGDLRWRERKRLFGSEFYVTGAYRKAIGIQALLNGWLAARRNPVGDRRPPRVGSLADRSPVRSASGATAG